MLEYLKTINAVERQSEDFRLTALCTGDNKREQVYKYLEKVCKSKANQLRVMRKKKK